MGLILNPKEGRNPKSEVRKEHPTLNIQHPTSSNPSIHQSINPPPNGCRGPVVVVQYVRIPQPNGDILLRPGKPVVKEEMVGTAEAARMLGASMRWVQAECEAGKFVTAYRLGSGPRAWWKIARSEVVSWIEQRIREGGKEV